MKSPLAVHYIDGAWISGSGDTLISINPIDQTPLWEGTIATEDDVLRAYHAAKKALSNWSSLNIDTRIQYLQAFAREVDNHRTKLSVLISKETGKPNWEALTEVQAVIAKINISIQAYQERTSDQIITQVNASAGFRYKPHGIMAVLGPFNFPAHLSNGHIIPALLAGNTVIYKPSELTPAVAEFIVQCWQRSGLPHGVLNLIQGNRETAQHLLKQDIQGVAFTGSYQAGLSIHQSMSQRPEVILALEMGGNNPLIIEKVNDIPAAIYQTLLSSFITAGQRCSCARRVFIPNTAYGDDVLNQLITASLNIKIGAPDDLPEPFMGPVISSHHAEQHLKSQKKLQQLGGKTLLNMALVRERSSLLSPGIIDMTTVDKPPDEEIFAPLIQIHRYQHFDDALYLANQTQYGLTAGLFSDNRQLYERFYNTIRAGLIYWNRATTGGLSNLPFGGIGHSGNHRASAYFATDYCAYPIATLEQKKLSIPEERLPGIAI